MMAKKEYNLIVHIPNRGTSDTPLTPPLEIPLTEGKTLFVLGANGVGKSALMQKFFDQNHKHAKRILAHRQTCFRSNSMEMTASSKKQTEGQIKSTDLQVSSRWKDDYLGIRPSISIFDLISFENSRSRGIAGAVDKDDIQSAKQLSDDQKSPLQEINELLAISNIPIEITLGKDEQLFASKNKSKPYSIAELSDGERNALLICSDVLTTPKHNLIILDEPERHLHRSIISPLLSSLFQKRKDCAFVISTHDVSLPIDHSESSVLLLRSCQWAEEKIKDWDADLILEKDNIPDSVKQEILGSKRDILFVEGSHKSLDIQIYCLIFSNVTVIPQGNCSQVEKAVKGIKETETLHWINAYGLIDADDKTLKQIETLRTKGIATLECYSVESLYYNLEVVKKIAKKTAERKKKNETELYEKATSEIIASIQPHKEDLCSRLCERQIRSMVMKKLPKHEDIKKGKSFVIDPIDFKEVLEKEEAKFDKMVADKNYNGLIDRYPTKATQVLQKIANGLGLKRAQYEASVRELIIDDPETQEFYKTLLAPLTTLIDEPKTTPLTALSQNSG